MLTILFLAPIEVASAWAKTAVIWGSESSGADDWNFDPPNRN